MKLCILALVMFNFPNLMTASNLLCGVISIFLAFSGQLELACVFIYVAAILDFFDGFLARKLNKMSELGKQLDSLADMVTFGVAPGVLVCVLLIVQSYGGVIVESGISFSEVVAFRVQTFLGYISKGEWSSVDLICFAGLIIPFFSLFRLAKFNIDTRQSESFIGLPTPANTIFFTSFPLLLANQYASGVENAVLNWAMQPLVLIIITLIMSILLIAELPLFSLKFKQYNFKGNEIKFIFLILCLGLIVFLQAGSIPFIIISYLFLSVINNQLKKKES